MEIMLTEPRKNLIPFPSVKTIRRLFKSEKPAIKGLETMAGFPFPGGAQKLLHENIRRKEFNLL